MQILIISHVIYPFISPRAFRTTELAKELARIGNNVTVLCSKGDFDYSHFSKSSNLEIKDFNNLRFINKNSSSSRKDGFINKVFIYFFRRVLQYPNIEFLWKVNSSLKNEKNYDVIISIGAPHSIHWGTALALKKNQKLGKMWIADCGDPFMFNKFERSPFYFGWLEKWFCRKADHITVPIEAAKDAYYPEFRNKISVIPQGFNFDNINIFQGKINNAVPTFAYAGNLYRGNRDPTVFLEYLTTLQRDFKFILYTASNVIVDPFKARLKEKLEIRKYLPREELLFELSKMDFLINFENSSSTQSPSKLIDYSITKRPILNIHGSDTRFDDFDSFMMGDYSSQVLVDMDQYDIKNVTRKFLNLIAQKTT